MKVEVDADLCIGSMSCEASCPEVFKVVGGISTVLMDEVPAELEDACREAMANCPIEAITIVEE